MSAVGNPRTRALVLACLLGIGLPACQTLAAPPPAVAAEGDRSLQHDAETCDLVTLRGTLGLASGKAQLESPDAEGRTPLSLAARGGCIKVVSMLVREGADLERTDAKGWTALHHAASQRHADVVDFLLAHGADQERKTRRGETPLALALVGTREQFGPPGDRHTTEMVLLSGHPRQKIDTTARATIKPVAKSRKRVAKQSAAQKAAAKQSAAKPSAAKPASRPATPAKRKPPA